MTSITLSNAGTQRRLGAKILTLNPGSSFLFQVLQQNFDFKIVMGKIYKEKWKITKYNLLKFLRSRD